MYYNTNDETGDTLQNSRVHSENQKDIIYRVFQANPSLPLTPFEIEAAVGRNWPITSIRRAITDLTSEGLLEKTDIKRLGKYGKNTFCWRFLR